MYSKEDIQSKMEQLIAPMDQQLLLCNSRNEELMLACVMLQRVREIFDTQLGIEGRKQMFKDLI
jgi:hypothetical protein